MVLRGKLNLILLLVMLAAQGALAHHATVHFALQDEAALSDVVYEGHDHQAGHPADHSAPGHEPGHEKHDHCAVCVLAHALFHVDLAAALVLALWAIRTVFVWPPLQKFPAPLFFAVYRARAPPAFLI